MPLDVAVSWNYYNTRCAIALLIVFIGLTIMGVILNATNK
jgi:hypothetical protein